LSAVKSFIAIGRTRQVRGNDRPFGIGRNTVRATGQRTINLYAAYRFAFGQRAPLPPGIGVFGGGGTAQVRTFDQGTVRYRVELTCRRKASRTGPTIWATAGR
jgi:hypothetical protein